MRRETKLIDIVQRLEPYSLDLEFITGLAPNQQSLLKEAANDGRHFHSPVSQIIRNRLEALTKVPLMMTIMDTLADYRPETIGFTVGFTVGIGHTGIPSEQMEKLIARKDAIYIKRNNAFTSSGVSRFTKTDDGYVGKDVLGNYNPEHHDSLAAKAFRDSFQIRNSFLVEAEIPIARTTAGKTSETRFVMMDNGNCYTTAKIAGAPKSRSNSLSIGGSWALPTDVIADVISRHHPQPEDINLQAEIDNYLERAKAIAQQVKDIVDATHLAIARDVWVDCPDDLIEAFRTTFMIVDITQVWNPEANRLEPVIIEAQNSGLIPDQDLIEVAQKIVTNFNDRLNRIRGLKLTA